MIAALNPTEWAEERNIPMGPSSHPAAYRVMLRDAAGQIAVMFVPASMGGMRSIAEALHRSFVSDPSYLTGTLTTAPTEASFVFTGLSGGAGERSGQVRVVRRSGMTDALAIIIATWTAAGRSRVTAAEAVLRESMTIVPLVPADDPRMALAACLTERGYRMYGASWCGHCEEQAEAFGRAFSRVMYTECSPEGTGARTLPECRDAGIASFPTWVLPDGAKLSGTQSLAALAERSGCPWTGGSE